ncbi:ferritin-like domain-containing protein [Streptomyces sp. NBC_01190]|uniref:ferritin-like domain-containing protein n=1 Tax=Streptomyces sp. NBC_01190 TaxID=2903767 RepID=UPI003865D773|nr:ferritin-like domain-containing protein [Streptomyces sp. NBC_01190]
MTTPSKLKTARDPDAEELHSYDVFPAYQNASWEMNDIPWDEFRPDLVRPEYIAFAIGAVMGESNSIAAQHGFFNEFVDDYDFSAFVCLWGYQELQHHLAFKKWLRLAGTDVDYEQINAMRAPYPPGITPSATLATNIISEIATNHMYKCVSRATEEPVIATIMKRASGDEARHAREFIHYTARRLVSHPEELASVLETFYVYMADPKGRYNHPVSKFKGNLPELDGHVTIDEVFRHFGEVDDGTEWDRIHRQLFNTLAELTGRPVEKLRDIRRILAELPRAEDGAR